MTASIAHQQWLNSEIRAVLTRLAAPAAEQLHYLRGLGPSLVVDELALEFDDIAEATATTAGVLSADQQEAVRSVGEQLESMSGSERRYLWTPEALEETAEWETVRQRASLALLRLA